MKNILIGLVFWPAVAFSHGAHEDLKSVPAPSGASLYQFESSWTDQNGRTVKLAQLQGQPRLVVMLFTKCETACPLLVQDIKEIAKEIEAYRPGVVGVSLFSLDSNRETPESLATFAKKRKLPANWVLFRSNANCVAELAAALGVRYKRLDNGDFIHSNTIYFLNSKGEIVSQKDGLKTPNDQFIKAVKKQL